MRLSGRDDEVLEHQAEDLVEKWWHQMLGDVGDAVLGFFLNLFFDICFFASTIRDI